MTQVSVNSTCQVEDPRSVAEGREGRGFTRHGGGQGIPSSAQIEKNKEPAMLFGWFFYFFLELNLSLTALATAHFNRAQNRDDRDQNRG